MARVNAFAVCHPDLTAASWTNETHLDAYWSRVANPVLITEGLFEGSVALDLHTQQLGAHIKSRAARHCPLPQELPPPPLRGRSECYLSRGRARGDPVGRPVGSLLSSSEEIDPTKFHPVVSRMAGFHAFFGF